jgi:hypothetical protein
VLLEGLPTLQVTYRHLLLLWFEYSCLLAEPYLLASD